MITGQSIILKNIGEYVYIGRTDVRLHDGAEKQLAVDAEKDRLDFFGLVYGRTDAALPCGVFCPDGQKEASLCIGRIYAGVYKKDLLVDGGIEDSAAGNPFELKRVLWNAFVNGKRARLELLGGYGSVRCRFWGMVSMKGSYSMKQVYDSIRGGLMDDWELWQSWKYYFTAERYRSCCEQICYMSGRTGRDFCGRLAVDMHRSAELSELDENLLRVDERAPLRVMAVSADFATKYYVPYVVRRRWIKRAKNYAKKLLGRY